LGEPAVDGGCFGGLGGVEHFGWASRQEGCDISLGGEAGASFDRNMTEQEQIAAEQALRLDAQDRTRGRPVSRRSAMAASSTRSRSTSAATAAGPRAARTA
jgi:hypothetical protein